LLRFLFHCNLDEGQGRPAQRLILAKHQRQVASDVRIGRVVELELKKPEDLDAMCEQLFANPLIEDYEIELLDAASPS